MTAGWFFFLDHHTAANTPTTMQQEFWEIFTELIFVALVVPRNHNGNNIVAQALRNLTVFDTGNFIGNATFQIATDAVNEARIDLHWPHLEGKQSASMTAVCSSGALSHASHTRACMMNECQIMPYS